MSLIQISHFFAILFLRCPSIGAQPTGDENDKMWILFYFEMVLLHSVRKLEVEPILSWKLQHLYVVCTNIFIDWNLFFH